VPAYVIVPSQYIAAILAVGLGGFALVPPKLVWRAIRSAGFAWAYALPAGVIAWALMSLPVQVGDPIWNGPFWRPATDLTFYVVSALLHLFLPVADRATMTIGGRISPSPSCWFSGWEGTALIGVQRLVALYRRGFHFPKLFSWFRLPWLSCVLSMR
jgi:hypothetical protein